MSNANDVRNNLKIREYIEIIEKVSKVEQRRIPSHMIEYEELVSIGILAIQSMIKDKTAEQLEKYNNSYIATAVRWAIRNELRNRFKWYSLKHKKDTSDDENNDGIDLSPAKVKEAIYETILSIDSLADAASDNDSPFDFVKDPSALPDEKIEISEISKMIREAIATLPPKERTVVEYRFYRNMQVKDIATQVGLSSSRITRIVQGSLHHIRCYLRERGYHG